MRFFLGAPDALYTESAFFHDTSAAYGDIGIELVGQAFFKVRIEKIKETDFIRIVILAITRPHTPVVGLEIYILDLTVTGRINRADRFARRTVALLAVDG